ncbi:radical SAM protein [Methanofollis tationis]|uniref:Radical SAM protein n=1 Tax=Methanofollis tationis TaxID=81417 RepID=A0A7K4HLU1_9EURY|nr:radical SAM protein [Methanofollis tationis]NVO66027.1 radical SAM protein [Methanofollis tationis]
MIEKLMHGLNNPCLVEDWLKRRYYHVIYRLPPNKLNSPHCQRIALSLNSICNLKCRMCDIGQRRSGEFYKNVTNGGELSIDTLRLFIEDVVNSVDNPPVIAINGTEPLLYPHIADLIKYIRSKNIMCELTTNGYLLQKFAQDLVKIQLPLINISIHGPESIHNAIVGVPNSFEKSYRGIEQIIEMKSKTKSKFPKIFVAFTISDANYQYLSETATIFKDLGVDGIKFTHLNFVDNEMAQSHNEKYGWFYEVKKSSVGSTTPCSVDVDVLSDEIKAVNATYQGKFVYFSPNIDRSDQIWQYYHKSSQFIGSKKCVVPWTNMQVLSNGDVIPASRCFHIKYGNIYTNTFNEIWFGQNAMAFRDFLRKVGATPACSRCCGIF